MVKKSLTKRQQDNLNIVFISVDPERDTHSVIKEYLKDFHPSIIGLTGSVSEIKDVAEKYKIYAKKNYMDESNKNIYMVDHSPYIYLFDKKGQYVEHFSYTDKPSLIKEYLQRIL